MRMIVTGCAGFIGFHLCERLLADGHEVVGVDNLSSGSPRNRTDLERDPKFRFVEHDICRPLDIDGAVDRVFNLACPASPRDFRTRGLEILRACSTGVWNLLEYCTARSIRLLHTSTSEVYGDPLRHPQSESYWGNVNPVGPRSCYDEGKRFAEALITTHRRDHAVEVRIARIFNTYGPRMRTDDGRALPNFIAQALAGAPLTVHGDGAQTRSFCYVSDLVDGLVRLMESSEPDPVNLGNPEEVTILDFAREVVRLSGNRSEIRHVGRPADDPNVRRPDITRARTILGWEPRVAREDGLRRTVDALRAEAG